MKKLFFAFLCTGLLFVSCSKQDAPVPVTQLPRTTFDATPEQVIAEEQALGQRTLLDRVTFTMTPTSAGAPVIRPVTKAGEEVECLIFQSINTTELYSFCFFYENKLLLSATLYSNTSSDFISHMRKYLDSNSTYGVSSVTNITGVFRSILEGVLPDDVTIEELQGLVPEGMTFGAYIKANGNLLSILQNISELEAALASTTISIFVTPFKAIETGLSTDTCLLARASGACVLTLYDLSEIFLSAIPEIFEYLSEN